MHYLANVPGHEHFLAKDPTPTPTGISTIWLMSQGMSTFWLRTPTSTPPPPSGHKHYLANVPGHEYFLAKDPPFCMSTFFCLPAQGMQSIYEYCLRVILYCEFRYGKLMIKAEIATLAEMSLYMDLSQNFEEWISCSIHISLQNT